MSEDKKKNARLQGRFSNEKERSSRRDKDKQHDKKGLLGQGEHLRDHTSGQKKAAAEGMSVQYSENSNFSFKELEEKKKPEEIRVSGIRELSRTQNGTSRIIYEPHFIHESEADEYFEILVNTTKWYDKNIIIHGTEVPQPRLVAWYGPFPYSYSGAVLNPADMPSAVHEIRDKVEAYLKHHNLDVTLNSVLLNHYRNEKDSVAWHSDDELMMGVCPTIASVSLGEVRKFEMKPKVQAVKEMEGVDSDTIYFVNLKPGSLIIMDGCMQKDWMHRVPKEYHSREPRINLTFRTVYPIDKLPPEMPYKTIGSSDRLYNSKIVQQDLPVFDSEDFPTLTPIDNQKSKISDDLETSHTPSSTSQNRYGSEEIISGTVDVKSKEDTVDNDINQNNLNKDIDFTGIVDETVPSNREDNNFNLLEPEKSSDVKLPVDKCMLNEPQSSDYGSMQEEISHGKLDDRCSSKVSNSDIEDREDTRGRMKNRSRLNANAPDFVPQQMAYMTKSQFGHCNLSSLANIYYRNDVGKEDMDEFMGALFGKLSRIHKSYFTQRDWHELDVLCKISDGSQSEKNQKLINDRICSMIKNAEFKQNDFRSPQRYQRTVYNSSDYGRPKNSYQMNSRRY